VTALRATLRRAIVAHVTSRDVTRVVYGAVVGLALVVALESHPPSAGQCIALVVATAIAVGLAEMYAELVGTAARERRPVTRADVRRSLIDALAVTLGAVFPAVFLILAAADVFSLATAFQIARWTGVGLLCAYGFAGARLAGFGLRQALIRAAAVGAIGGLLIEVKSLVH
jgi:hypothetical protein